MTAHFYLNFVNSRINQGSFFLSCSLNFCNNVQEVATTCNFSATSCINQNYFCISNLKTPIVGIKQNKEMFVSGKKNVPRTFFLILSKFFKFDRIFGVDKKSKKLEPTYT